MSDFHGRMMNIQTVPASKIVGDVRSFAEGHKQARHAAAEIALEADAEIERLKARIEAAETARVDGPGQSTWDKEASE